MSLFSKIVSTEDEINKMLTFADIIFNENKNNMFTIRAADKKRDYKPTHWLANENQIKDENKSKYPNYEQLKNDVFTIAHKYVFSKFTDINTSKLQKDKMYCSVNYLDIEAPYEYEGMGWHTDDEPNDHADVIIFYLQKDDIIGGNLKIKNPEVEEVEVKAGDVVYIHGSLPHCVTKATSTNIGKRIALMFVYPRE